LIFSRDLLQAVSATVTPNHHGRNHFWWPPRKLSRPELLYDERMALRAGLQVESSRRANMSHTEAVRIPSGKTWRRQSRRMLSLPAEIEEHRDRYWRRDESLRVDTAVDAERFIDQVGFAACLTDARRPGPSLYVAVCGRRDAVMPRHVQQDEEASHTWVLKDEILARGRVYYAKLARGRATFVAPRMIRYFHAVWGLRRSEEGRRLSRPAQALLRVVRREWEIATLDLRQESGVKDRRAFNRAMDELQAAMLVVPSAVVYRPFTYIWTLAVGRFPDELRRRVSRPTAVREIARSFLAGAGMTVPGELSRVTGLSRPEAGLGNRALVAEGFATMPARGVYRLTG
jgi:hypothetical protein